MLMTCTRLHKAVLFRKLNMIASFFRFAIVVTFQRSTRSANNYRGIPQNKVMETARVNIKNFIRIISIYVSLLFLFNIPSRNVEIKPCALLYSDYFPQMINKGVKKNVIFIRICSIQSFSIVHMKRTEKPNEKPCVGFYRVESRKVLYVPYILLPAFAKWYKIKVCRQCRVLY